MELNFVALADVDKHREAVLPYIDSFVERAGGRYDIDDVFFNIKEGCWKLWVVHENLVIRAVLITQFIQYPKVKELQIIMCVGESYEDWYFLVNKMEEYASLSGCKKITAVTRPGWEKIMRGYKKTHVYLERNL